MLVFVIVSITCTTLFGDIGEAARERAAEVANEAKPLKIEDFQGLVNWVPKLVFLLVVLALGLALMASRLVDFNPLKKVKANGVNAKVFVFFGLLFGASILYEIVYHLPRILPESSSQHGQGIDTLMTITVLITGFVFIVTQSTLFYFAHKYRYKENNSALFYPDNHKLELLWTAIPAVGLFCIVLPGLIFWNEIINPDLGGKKLIPVELVGEQFQWRIRFPGKDGKLGKAGFKMISATNPVGVDSTDSAAMDDIVPAEKEMHFPVNEPVQFQIRSKDVLHGVFAPHFRVNIYAVPGMPTKFTFTPIYTTEEMRAKLKNPDFNYELLCSQLCGAAHYNMRVKIVVESQEDYNKWLAAQPTLMPEKNLTQHLPAQQ